MAAIKAIIFDAGGVLLKNTYREFLANALEKTGLKPEKIPYTAAVFDRKLNLGKASVKQTLEKIFPKASEGQIKQLLVLWKKAWPTDWEMVELARKLKKRYTVSLLSNSDPVHEKRLAEEGFLQLFEKPVLSHRAGQMKPGPGIFRLALKNLGARADECILVDDALENIEAAKKLGFKTILFRSRKQCERELKKKGVEF